MDRRTAVQALFGAVVAPSVAISRGGNGSDGKDVEIGTGPNELQLLMGMHDREKTPSEFGVLVNNKVVAPYLVLNPWALAGDTTGKQLYVIHGNFGQGPYAVRCVGTHNGWGNQVDYYSVKMDLVPLVQTDGTAIAYQTFPQDTLWQTGAVAPPVVVALPPPPPPETLVDGTHTVAQLALGLGVGETLTLPAGKFVTGPVKTHGTIVGVPGQTILDATGHEIPKGIITALKGCVIRGLILTGAKNGDNNAAGVRSSDPGDDFRVEDCEIRGNQDGILAHDNTNVTVRRIYLHDNGAGKAGSAHNLYAGGGACTLIFEDSKSEKSNGGHALKSRSQHTYIRRSTLTGGGNESALDVPGGGDLMVEDTQIILPSGSANRVFLGYGVEPEAGLYGANVGMNAVIRNVVFTNQTGQQTYIIGHPTMFFKPGVGVTYKGVAPVLQGWANANKIVIANGTITERP